MTVNVNCILCRHYIGAWLCKAFPEGIPREIQRGENDHRAPLAGDHGIQFEPRPSATEQEARVHAL